ncbi:MAG: dTMP kinase [Candidatus Hodarchaeota archaeon]
MSEQKGKFIVFEGLDGAGTSTQMLRLKKWLSKNNVPAELTKEPSNGPFGAVIRQAIEARISVDPVTRALAFACDRVDHLFNKHNGIKLSLDSGIWVLSDRYILSSLAYQNAEDIDLEWLISINKFIVDPDLTIFIDTPTETCLERLKSRSSHLELFHDGSKLGKVLKNYRDLLHTSRFVGDLITINGGNTEQKVFNELIEDFQKWLEKYNLY